MSIDTFAEVERTAPPTEDELVVNNRYRIAGGTYTRASKWAEAITDTYNLSRWSERMVALGVTHNRDLQLAISAAKDDKSKLNDLCVKAREAAKAGEGRDIGTSLHALVERINRGETVDVAEPWASDLATYRETLRSAGIEVVADLIERVVVCEPLAVAGRFDFAARVPGYERPVVCDLKTGGYLSFLSWAVQLSLYARATKLYDRTTGTLVDKLDFEPDVGVVVHLPEGQASCTLYVVDLAAGWQAAQLCGAVRNWRTRKDLATVYDPAQRLILTRTFLQRRIERLAGVHPDALALLASSWPEGVPTLKASADHDEFALSLIEQVVVDYEARFGLPFVGGGDPAGGLVVLDSERMVERLKALPPDLLAVVEAGAAGKIPNLRSLGVTRAHLDALEQFVGPVEAEAERRRAAAWQAVEAELGSDGEEFCEAFAAYVTAGERAWHRLTESDIETLRRVCADIGAGRLCIGWDDDGTPLIRDAEAGAA